MRSVPRYPEVREDGSLWLPLAPPPAPSYRRVLPGEVGVIGCRAVLSYSTEWLLDLRVVSDPRPDPSDNSRWIIELCDDDAWHGHKCLGREIIARDRVIASVTLVFLLVEGPDTDGLM